MARRFLIAHALTHFVRNLFAVSIVPIPSCRITCGDADLQVKNTHGGLDTVEPRAEWLELARHGYVLETGSIALEGEAKGLASNEHVKTAYLGILAPSLFPALSAVPSSCHGAVLPSICGFISVAVLPPALRS